MYKHTTFRRYDTSQAETSLMSLKVMDVDMVKIATKASVLELFFLGIPSSTQEPSQVERALKGFRSLCMWQIEPVATTWQIGLSRSLAGLNQHGPRHFQSQQKRRS